MIAFLARLHIPPFRRIHGERLAAEYIALAKAQLARMDTTLEGWTPEVKAEIRARFLASVGLTERHVA
jgi:hypothetical protein